MVALALTSPVGLVAEAVTAAEMDAVVGVVSTVVEIHPERLAPGGSVPYPQKKVGPIPLHGCDQAVHWVKSGTLKRTTVQVSGDVPVLVTVKL